MVADKLLGCIMFEHRRIHQLDICYVALYLIILSLIMFGLQQMLDYVFFLCMIGVDVAFKYSCLKHFPKYLMLCCLTIYISKQGIRC